MQRDEGNLQNEEIVNKEKTWTWHYGWSGILAGIVILTVAYRYALPTRDGDIWFHLLYGQYFLENKTLIADHTLFSWTPSSNEYIYCTWLSDIFLYLLHKASGLPGLFVFRYACIFTLVLACYLFAREQKVVTHPLTWLACLLSVLMSYAAIAEKPEILSFLFMTLFCWNWWHIRIQGERAWRNCYFFPMIMLVWVNSHGGFIFGCLFLLVVWIGEMLNTWLSPGYAFSARLRRHLFIALILAVFSLLVTPYGYQYPLQLLQEFFLSDASLTVESTIASYNATFAAVDVFGFALCANIAVCLLLLLLVAGFRKIEWSLLLVNIVFISLYACFLRTTFYWAAVFLFSSLYLLPAASRFLLGGRFAQKIAFILPPVVLLISMSLSGHFLYRSVARPEAYVWMGFGITQITAVDEVEYIVDNFPDSRIGNTYNNGSYLLWRLWPHNKIFVDARYFPYHAWIKEALAAFQKGENIDKFVGKYPCDLWLIDFSSKPALMWFFSSPEWRLAFYGKSAAVFVGKGVEIPEGVPRVSNNLSDPKNLANTAVLLSFALNISDWENVDDILLGMEKNFSFFPYHKRMVEDAIIFCLASRFYAEKQYGQAVFWFDKTRRIALKNDEQYAHALIHLSVEAWQNKNSKEARRLNQRAWGMYPGYFVNVYNAAAMNWYDWQQGQLTSSGVDVKGGEVVTTEELWRKQFQEFLKIVPPKEMLGSYIEFARQRLAGEIHGEPILLLPPEESAW